MAFDKAILENPHMGQIRKAPVGFSWTMFFFSFFAAMFRGDWKWAIIILLISLVVGALTAGFLAWLPGVIAAFMWNKSYLDRMISSDFQLKGTERGSSLDRVDSALGYRARRVDE